MQNDFTLPSYLVISWKGLLLPKANQSLAGEESLGNVGFLAFSSTGKIVEGQVWTLSTHRKYQM